MHQLAGSLEPSPGQGLLLGPADAPLITVTPLAEVMPETAPLALPREAQAAITGLLQLLPAVAATSSTSEAYLLHFASHLSAQLATGQTALMQAVEGGARAIAVDAQGTILGHGRLIPLTGLRPALATAALWQVAAVATAQHYLVAMQQQLDRVERAIGALRDWLNDREIASLVTSARWLQDTLGAHMAEPDAERSSRATQIEQIAREAALVVEARRMSLSRAAEQVRALPLADPIWWNVERNVATLRETLIGADHDARVGAMGLAIWVIAAQARRTLGAPSPLDQLDHQRLSDARAQLGDAHRLVGEIALARAASISAPSDLRNALPSLQATVRAQLAAATEQRIADLAALEQGMRVLRDERHPAPHQLVARRAPDGSWTLAPYQPQAAKEGPGGAQITADVLNRLLGVPGLALANLQDASSAKARFTLRNGLAITSWRNLAGFNHVFVRDSSGRAIFGGFVGWDNGPLEDAIREIWRCYA